MVALIISLMDTQQIVAALVAERDRLSRAIEILQGTTTKRRGRPPKNPLANAPEWVTGKPAKKKRRKFSAEQRAAASERMRRRWAAKKKAAAKSQPKTGRKKAAKAA